MSLHAAVHCGHVGVVKALLNKGASVDTKTKVITLINDIRAFIIARNKHVLHTCNVSEMALSVRLSPIPGFHVTS